MRRLLAAGVVAVLAVASSGMAEAEDPSSAAGAGPTAEAAPAETCRLPRADGAYWLDEGPSDFETNLRPDGVLKAVMLFVDFSDEPETGSTNRYRDALAPGAEWFDEVSYGRVDLQITPVDHWYRMSRPSTDYGWSSLTFGSHYDYIADAVAAADADVDFSQYDIVYIVPPEGATAIHNSPTFIAGLGGGVPADGGEIRHAVTFGTDMWFWGYEVLNHETGHLFSLPDLYGSPGSHRFVGGWDLMGLINGGAPGFLAWHRWKLGWIDDDQIDCLADAGQSEHTISLLAVGGGTEAVVVRTGPQTAYVAEYRRNIGVDSALCDDGLLIYSVDTTVPGGQGPVHVMDAQPHAVTACHPLSDATFEMGAGEHAVFTDPATGVTIEVIGRTAQDITVRVEVQPVAGVTCGGRVVGVDLARGQRPTDGSDVIRGTSGNDVIDAAAGDDVVCGGGGLDTVDGGIGRDRLIGGGAGDVLTGGPGADTLVGGEGDDALTGLGGADHLAGGLGRDRCDGGFGRDTHAGCEARTSIP